MNFPHQLALAQLNSLLAKQLAGRADILCQTPITLNGDTEPEPDFAIVRLEWRNTLRHPGPREVFWLIEIAESSRAFDRDVKIPRFASVGIPESWLIDLIDDVVVVYRDPQPGSYATALTFKRGETIAPLAFPDEHFPVSEILPPR